MECVPLDGFMQSSMNWWYENNYTEGIQDTYAIVIPSMAPPVIQPLNKSIESRFQNRMLSELVKATFVE